MNMEYIDSLIDDGWSEEEIVAAFNKRKNEKLKDVRVEKARTNLLDVLVDYLDAVNPELVDFKDEEEMDKFVSDAEKELKVLEKFLKATPKKNKAKTGSEDAIWNFLKANNLM